MARVGSSLSPPERRRVQRMIDDLSHVTLERRDALCITWQYECFGCYRRSLILSKAVYQLGPVILSTFSLDHFSVRTISVTLPITIPMDEHLEVVVKSSAIRVIMSLNIVFARWHIESQVDRPNGVNYAGISQRALQGGEIHIAQCDQYL